MSRLRWALAALLAGCLLAGCSDDDPKPDIGDPTPSATSSPPTVSTSPTETTDVLSPREAVDAWLAAWTLAMQTGDTSRVAALSTSDCVSCQRLIRKVAELYEKGGRLETDGWTAIRVGPAPDSDEQTPSFVMQVVQAHQVLFDETGQVVHDTKRNKVPMRMTFVGSNGDWHLGRLEILE